MAAVGEAAIQHAEIGAQRALSIALLEHRPTVLEQGTVVVGAGGTEGDDALVGLFRLGEITEGEVDLGTTELNLVAVAYMRIFLHQTVEGGQGLVQLAVEFVGARQLVEHAVIAGVIGV